MSFLFFFFTLLCFRPEQLHSPAPSPAGPVGCWPVSFPASPATAAAPLAQQARRPNLGQATAAAPPFPPSATDGQAPCVSAFLLQQPPAPVKP